MVIDRDELERYLENYLSLEIVEGGFTNPNGRTVMLMLGNKEISRVSFDVVQKAEYGDY